MAAAGRQSGQVNDAELLRRVGLRDREAFHRLYLEYFGRLGRFLTRVTRRPEVIEEVINDTMFAVWNQAAHFRGDSKPSTWIFGIAYRLALKAIRRDTAFVQSPMDMPQDADESHIEDLLGRAELDDWLQSALARLSAEHRLAIELAYFMGMSCEEIAGITDCPTGTVKTRIFHARRQLKHILQRLATPAFASHYTGGLR